MALQVINCCAAWPVGFTTLHSTATGSWCNEHIGYSGCHGYTIVCLKVSSCEAEQTEQRPVEVT